MITQQLFWTAYVAVAIMAAVMAVWLNRKADGMFRKHEMRSYRFVDEKVERSYRLRTSWSRRCITVVLSMMLGVVFYAMGVWSLLITLPLLALVSYIYFFRWRR